MVTWPVTRVRPFSISFGSSSAAVSAMPTGAYTNRSRACSNGDFGSVIGRTIPPAASSGEAGAAPPSVVEPLRGLHRMDDQHVARGVVRHAVRHTPEHEPG